MPHCDAVAPEMMLESESEAALERAQENMAQLIADPRTRELRDILFVYEITSERYGVRQIGLGGMARTAEIRTPDNPHGPIIRNEGVREPKAKGRARLTERTRADMGTVNNAVDDVNGAMQVALDAWAGAHRPAFETIDEDGNRHRLWLVEGAVDVERMRALPAAEPHAYVADGNHRSAAAALLGYTHFLAVFFPAAMMRIAPYNRLVSDTEIAPDAAAAALAASFESRVHDGPGALQPAATHEIGFYDGRRWHELHPRTGTFDPADAAQDIDADIVQRNLFAAVFGIDDARDERLTFVGANRDAAWLQAEVDAGRARYAVTLPPVTMAQFIRVCQQNRLMPPKSTWFVPKVRSGLVMALLG